MSYAAESARDNALDLEALRACIAAGTMTAATWNVLDRGTREAVRDTSQLHPLLTGLEGWRVAVTYAPGTKGVGKLEQVR